MLGSAIGDLEGGVMSIDAAQFRKYVLDPALDALVPAGIPRHLSANALVSATIAHESLLGTFLVQDGGPALGIGQIEPDSLNDLLERMTSAEHQAIVALQTPERFQDQIVTNLKLSCAMVRLFYWHKPFALAETVTVAWLWETYKRWYNTAAGAADEAEFVAHLALTDLAFAQNV